MKKLLIISAFILFGCSTDKSEPQTQQQTCYPIISKGVDARGSYIIINYSNFVQKRYLVDDYTDYINQNELCEPITLTQQPL